MTKLRRNEIHFVLLLLLFKVRAHSSGQEDDSHHSGHHDEVLPHPDFRKIIEEYPNLGKFTLFVTNRDIISSSE